MRIALWVAAALSLVLAIGCDSGGDDSSSDGGGSGAGGGGGGGNKATGQGPCEEASECAGNVCVGIIDGNNPPVYCTESCDDGNCPDGFHCDSNTFSLVGVTFCRFGGTEPMMEETPSEPPRLPCKEDADCEGDLVCATWMGQRDCTILCNAEADCTPPSVGGVTIDVATCGQDEGQDRMVCVPDENCFPNPITAGCIQGFPGLP
ncbi:MAG: hypothetical protein KC620_19695 [Myxococcales bacterium]|nr:hypothetical protein [Myxococcales bacterium]